jgi:hypothetical protein
MKRVESSAAIWTPLFIIAALVCPSIGGVVENQNKYGMCDDPKDVDDKKCAGQSGNCYNVALNKCASYATNCPGGGVATKSGKPIQFKQYGTCTGEGMTGDKCPKCAFFYCALAKLWRAPGCPGDVAAACTVAVGRANVCDPN